MKFIGFVTAVLTASMVTGCSNGSSGSNGNSQRIEIQEKTSPNYFEQFLYRVDGKCENKDELKFHYLKAKDIDHGTLPNGNPVRTYIKVYLNADHSFSADYKELEVTSVTHIGYKHKLLLQKKLEGSWKVEGEQISLSGLGSGSAVTYNDKDAVLFTFDNDISREGLKGKSTIMRFLWSATGEQSINEYCAE